MFTKKLLEMRRIEKNFSAVNALKKVDFDLYAGEVHCLIGENGAGKSTLIKIISGVLQASSGQIFLEGKEVNVNSPLISQKLGISTVYQELDLIPTLNVYENIFLGVEIVTSHGILDNKKMEEKTISLLDKLEIKLEPNQLIKNLSLINKQFVAIAKALYRKRSILIFDEPSAVLGIKELEILYNIIRRLKRNGLGIIYISHRLEEVFEIGDRITILRDGELIKTLNVGEANLKKLIKLVIGRSLKDQYIKKKSSQSGNSILIVRKLNRKGKLNDISFELNKGEILGICGLMGSGKKELGDAILGITPIDNGDIFIDGQKVNIISPRNLLKLGVGLIPEERKEQGLILCRSVEENIALVTLIKENALFDIVNRRNQKKMVKEYISKLNIKIHSLNGIVRNLSGGNQQKVVLAKWIASECKILIFNEPTRGIDVGAKREIYYIIGELVKEGLSIIIISSEIQEVFSIADRILIMSEGCIVREVLSKETDQEEILEIMSQRKTQVISGE